MRSPGTDSDEPVRVSGRQSTDVERTSPTSGSEPFTAVSPQLSVSGTALDQWEALDFSQPLNFDTPQGILRELGAIEPNVVAAHFVELQSRLGQALQEVDRLRGTVDQLHREASAASLSALESSGESEPPPPLWRPAWDGFRRGFTLTYFVRAGLGLTTRALQLVRQRRWQALSGWKVLSEEGLRYREDAVRLGLFVGGFTAIHALVVTHLRRRAEAQTFPSKAKRRASLLAGTLAGISLVVLGAERRRTLALYVAARVAQCWYNSAKAQGRWQLLSAKLGPSHGDSLLFALATAQIMYAYVMRPETLPDSYWRFIVRTGPIHPTALEAVRRSLRRLPVDLRAVNDYVSSRGGSRRLQTPFPRQIPAWVLDPTSASWSLAAWRAFAGTFKKTLPLYFSISVVPFVVLNLKRAMRSPAHTVLHALWGSVRSTTFLSSFVGIYMAAICLHRSLFTGDFKQLYWLAGVLASGSIFIEKKARRAELALYVLPRAMQSVFATLLHRRLLPNLPLWEVGLFALGMGALMHYREHEPDTMAPLISSLISRIVLGESPSKARQARLNQSPAQPFQRQGSGEGQSSAAPAKDSPAVAGGSLEKEGSDAGVLKWSP